MSKIPDYAYSKSLLHRLNSLVESRPDLRECFSRGEINYWYVFQQRIFNDIKVFVVSENKFEKKDSNIFLSIKELVVGFMLLSISIFSLVLSIILRKEVLVFSVDTISDSKLRIDKRLKPLFEALSLENKNYITFYHTITNFGAIQRAFRRGNGAVFMESFDYVYNLCGFLLPKQPEFNVEETFGNKSEIQFAKYLIRKYSQLIILSNLKTKFLTIYLRFSAIKKAFMIDDVRNYHEIVLACRANNIRTIAIQHGHYGPFHIGFLKQNLSGGTVKPDTLIVWSEFWQKELLRLNSIFDKSDMVIGGGMEDYQKIDLENDNDVNYFLVPFEKDLDKDIVLRVMRGVSQVEGWKVLFKLRDGVSDNIQFDAYNFTKEDREKIIGIKDTAKAFGMARIVAGVYSTLLYDALASGKQVVVIKTPSPYRPEGLLYYNLADEIDPDKNIREQLNSLISVSKEERKRRSEELTAGSENIRLVDTIRGFISK